MLTRRGRGRDDVRPALLWLAGMVLWHAGGVQALSFTVPLPGEFDKVDGVFNSTLTMGVGIRTQAPTAGLVGKSNLNPNLCSEQYQVCQGLFRDQVYPAQRLVAAPGAASLNGDLGDLNYGKGDIFQSPIKATEDLSLKYGHFGFFGRVLFFHDFTNDDFTETFPNEITPQNRDQVGRLGSTLPNGAFSVFVQKLAAAGVPESLLNATAVTGRFYGPGGVVHSPRTDSATLQQAGQQLQFLDSNVYGKLPLWGDRELSFKIGRQVVNWGESTTLAVNSINSVNPFNANNVYRIGGQVEEFFTPINMVDLQLTPVENFTVDTYYQLEWQPDQAPASGTYFSDVSIGTGNSGPQSVSGGFAGTALDPSCVGTLEDNPLSGLTPTCATFFRLPDLEPRTWGQFGAKLNYYFENLGSGVDFALYYEHYHSRLPYVSFFSAYPSCLRAEGNALGNNATNLADTLRDCPHVPLLTFGNPRAATSDALDLDTIKYALDYPEGIHLLGASFNTTIGDYSVQGEVAYRPNKPLQIDVHDLSFAALGHAGTACGQPGVNCEGTSGGGGLASFPGLGYNASAGTATYPSSDAIDANGNVVAVDTYNLLIGHAAGSQRYFPNFVIPYRGTAVGQNPPCYPAPGSADEQRFGFQNFAHPYYAYNQASPCYIRGYERFKDFEFNLGATRVYGSTDNWLGAGQIIMIYEAGAEYVPFMPAYDQLVLQGPNSQYGPTAGADGSGADRSRRACSTIPDCSYGPDGLRFNPHQQDPGGYPTPFSYGYRVISQLKYEQVLPGINVSPQIEWQQDLGGISPAPAGNFVKGRKQVDTLVEIRYHQALSLNLGYNWYWGGGVYNTLSDRDFAQAFIKYQF